MVEAAISATPALLGRSKPTRSCEWLRHFIAASRYLAAPLNQVLDVLEDLLQTIAEIAAAFAGFASVVVIFRRSGDIHSDTETKVTFQSMLLGSLFVVFFALLPQVLQYALNDEPTAYWCSAALLLTYIVITFAWGITRDGGRVRAGILIYLTAALTIASSQTLGLLGVVPLVSFYLVGVFALLVISGYAFFSLITFSEVSGGDV